MSTTAQPEISANFASTYRDMLMQSLEREFPVTAKVIRAIPQSKSSYKPDEKAKSAIELAWHLASSEVWFLDSIADGRFDPDGEKIASPGDIEAIAAWYEKETARAAARVKKLSGEQLLKSVDFFGAFQLPNFTYLQFEINHGVHHRGQLSTYLRPMGSKIPSIYGGSADEPWAG
jgi:uncharacterized damage-inducible protein DinB